MKTPMELLKNMTLDEKLAQLVAHGSPSDFVKDKKFNVDFARKNYPKGLFGRYTHVRS